ncbi:MAG: hypothetical protein AABY22_14080, partial [Nanoarchaeota archaeon]
MLRKIKLFIVVIFLSSYAFAYPSSKIYFLHINGVNTDRVKALKNLYELIEISKIKSNMVTYNILHNPTEGLTADLQDVFKQKKQEGKEITIDDYVIAYKKTYNLHYEIGSEEYQKLKGEIKLKYLAD